MGLCVEAGGLRWFPGEARSGRWESDRGREASDHSVPEVKDAVGRRGSMCMCMILTRVEVQRCRSGVGKAPLQAHDHEQYGSLPTFVCRAGC